MVELSLHVLDIVQNSIEAGATEVRVTVRDRPDERSIVLAVDDNGRGMDPEFVERVTDPFVTTRTTRKVGLGLPLLKQVAQASGGDMDIVSTKGKGTTVRAHFLRDNIDTPPLGDIPSSLAVAIATDPRVRFVYRYEGAKGAFEFDSFQVAELLGDVPVSEPSVVQWIKEYLKQKTREVSGG